MRSGCWHAIPIGYARQPAGSRFDMLTGRVPGDEPVIGMSRRPFTACRNVASEDSELLHSFSGYLAEPLRKAGSDLLGEDAADEWLTERRMTFADLEAAERQRFRDAARRGYEIGQASSWQQILRRRGAPDRHRRTIQLARKRHRRHLPRHRPRPSDVHPDSVDRGYGKHRGGPRQSGRSASGKLRYRAARRIR